MRQEMLEKQGIPISRAVMKKGVHAAIFLVVFCSLLEQLIGGKVVVVSNRKEQGSAFVAINAVNSMLVLQKELHYLDVPNTCSEMQGCQLISGLESHISQVAAQ